MKAFIDRVARWVGLALVLAVLFLLWDNHHLNTKVEDLKNQTSGLKADTAAATTHDKQTRVVYAQKEKAHAAVTKALVANPEWADQPVPADVSQLLRAPRSPTR